MDKTAKPESSRAAKNAEVPKSDAALEWVDVGLIPDVFFTARPELIDESKRRNTGGTFRVCFPVADVAWIRKTMKASTINWTIHFASADFFSGVREIFEPAMEETGHLRSRRHDAVIGMLSGHFGEVHRRPYGHENSNHTDTDDIDWSEDELDFNF